MRFFLKTGRDYVLAASMRFDVRGYPRPGKNILFFFFARSKSRVSVIRNTPPGNIYIYMYFFALTDFFSGDILKFSLSFTETRISENFFYVHGRRSERGGGRNEARSSFTLG